MTEFEQLQQELADSAAISDIESMCDGVGDMVDRWYDTESVHEECREELLKALKYLNYRNLIEKHPDNKYWVRVKR
jgi:hypothetical protein